MKVLFVATVRSHIGQFHMPFIRKLKELGCTVDAAFKDNSENKPGLDLSGIDTVYEIPFSRSPYSTDNIKAYKELKKVIDNGNYDIIHCHTPMGAVIARLAAIKARKSGTKVLYTAHGFHFYKGAPLRFWILFYPVEKLLARFTDCIITINSEDYKLAKKRFKSSGSIEFVPGVGIDLNKFNDCSKDEKMNIRNKNGYSDDDFLMIYPADFSYRKNQYMLFEALKLVMRKHDNVRLILPGATEGIEPFKEYCCNAGIIENVDFLGYRNDIFELDSMCDISVSSSRQEGLPINLIEAMAIGNPIIATDVRGNNDLVVDGVNGYLVTLNDYETMAKRIIELVENTQLKEKYGKASHKLAENYSQEKIINEMLSIYNKYGDLSNA